MSNEQKIKKYLKKNNINPDDYKGGEFIMFDDYEIKFKAGDLIIFPSVFLYPHLVKPVKKGIRYSFVSWCY